MVNYRSLPDKYANPLHNTAQKCDVVHLRRFGPARAPRRRVLAPRRVLLIPAATASEVRPQEGRRQEEEGWEEEEVSS